MGVVLTENLYPYVKLTSVVVLMEACISVVRIAVRVRKSYWLQLAKRLLRAEGLNILF